MLTNNSPHTERFNELLREVKDEINGLKAEVNELEKKNAQLKSELEKAKEQEADMFSSIKETDRMALKHQIKGLISKIDDHLSDQQ